MSQAHEIPATLQLPAARAVTWLNGLGCRLILIPTREALDCSCCISWVIHWVPEAYGMLKVSPCPDLTPLPHRLGFVQVLTPLGVTFQPWLASRLCAIPAQRALEDGGLVHQVGEGLAEVQLLDDRAVAGAALEVHHEVVDAPDGLRIQRVAGQRVGTGGGARGLGRGILLGQVADVDLLPAG